MALTPFIRATQAVSRVAARAVSPSVKAMQTVARAIINFPSENVQVTQMAGRTTAKADDQIIQVTQAVSRAVIIGRIDDPRVIAWPAFLDGHQFYVLQLGAQATVVCDLETLQWSRWNSPDLTVFRARHGTNWTGIGGQLLGLNSATSNIVAGDDTYGILWMLDPDIGYDEHPDDESEMAFERKVIGGVAMRMRQTVPCNEAYLMAVKGREDLTLSAPVLSLRTSDDAGNTWLEQGDIAVVADDWSQEFAWRSLGLVQAPGRLFEFTDNCLVRIDGLEIR